MGELMAGPLLTSEAGYVRWLVERGFRPGAVADRLGQFRALSRWLGARGLPVAALDPERVEEFLEARRAAGYRSYVAASSVRLPLDYLIGIGIAPLLEVSTPPSPVDCLLEKYRRYLLDPRPLLPERYESDVSMIGCRLAHASGMHKIEPSGRRGSRGCIRLAPAA
jgi:integrase/recombinase XerD